MYVFEIVFFLYSTLKLISSYGALSLGSFVTTFAKRLTARPAATCVRLRIYIKNSR